MGPVLVLVLVLAGLVLVLVLVALILVLVLILVGPVLVNITGGNAKNYVTLLTLNFIWDVNSALATGHIGTYTLEKNIIYFFLCFFL